MSFGFLAASFTARNSDLWLHLATGRLIADGEYQFGKDPFASTTAGKYWANHSWLFDWAGYRLDTAFGGESLVLLKALAVGLMAWAMLYACRGRGPIWVAVGCVALALLAMSPRLLLQPTIVSLLFLAICLCCLRAGGRSLYALPLLIALWVNLDAWFILGPLLVLLFWIGHRLNLSREAEPNWPRWLFPTTVVACLVSPHHVFAFQLPAELSPGVWSSDFVTDPRFAGVFASPWRWALVGSASGYSPAAWAFFGLLALSIVSFAINNTARRSWRVAVCLPFAILACWQVRLIPFFAVVAGPITALNFREVISPSVLLRSGRGFVLGGMAVLLAFAWFGWLQGMNNHDRAAAWRVHTDSTLVRAAGHLSELRRSGQLNSEQRVFVTHPDLSHYVAWFAPGERYDLDSRLQLFVDVAGSFKAHSQAVEILSDGAPPRADELPGDSFAAVAYYDSDASRLTRGLAALASPASRWQIAAVSGSAVLLTPKNLPTDQLRFDPEGEAFGRSSALRVAQDGPLSLSEPGEWWKADRRRNLGRAGSWEADAATVYLRVFESGPSKSSTLSQLAIRACRVGVENDPNDPVAWQTLARAYLLLGERSWERDAIEGFTLLAHVRNLQVIAALTQAVLLNPDSAIGHETLARTFFQSNRLDLAYRHASQALMLVRRTSPSPGDLARVIALADQLQERLFDSENRFRIRSAGLSSDPVARARIAVQLGLVQKAIDVLLASHPDLYGINGVGLLADLLLQSGQVAECRVLLDREEIRKNSQALGYYTIPRKPNPGGGQWPYRLPSYDWLDMCQCAAAGHYSRATAAIDRMAVQFEAVERSLKPGMALGAQSLVLREVGLSTPQSPVLGRTALALERTELTDAMTQTKSLDVTRADLLTVAGILEMERGSPADAAKRFAAAVGVYQTAKPFAISRPGEAVAAGYNDLFSRHR